MIGLSSLLPLAGLSLALSLWFVALAITRGDINPFLIFSGYPAQAHLEMAIGIFFLPILTVVLDKRGFIESPFRRVKKDTLLMIFYTILALLFIFSPLEKRIHFHITLFCYALLLWFSAVHPIERDDSGKRIDNFFSLSLLSVLSGSSLWILFDISNFSNAYLAGKILIIYGALNFSFFALFPSFTESRLNMKHLRWFIYLYLGSMIYEAILLIFLRERPPQIIGNGIRLAVSFYWLFYLMSVRIKKRFSIWNGILWMISVFHLAGLTGITFLSETGIHYGHLYLAGAITPVLLFSLPAFADRTENKRRGKYTYTIMGLIFFAALTRATAHLMPENNQSHLAYASFVMIAALFLLIFRYRRALF